MAVSSRFIKVHPDALIEWIQDDSFFYADNYSIIKDTLNNQTSFAFSANATDPFNYNKIPDQLYLIDGVINKFGIANPAVKPFLQETQYGNNSPSRFDKIKIWFPIHWTFPNVAGFSLKMWSLNYDNTLPYYLSNFDLDTTIPGNLSKIQDEPVPFRQGERLWGKTITIYVPSVYAEALNRTFNAPTLGTINHNLTNGIGGLSQTAPIFIDFRYLTSKSIILGETTFLSTPPLVVSIPQAPEYNNLAAQIVEATDGDYFLINGSYNGSLGEFDQFMAVLESSGKKSYVSYSITVFEEGIPQDTQEIFMYTDFFKQIKYAPILINTNTTASIEIEMKLISAIDGSSISRFADYTLIGANVAKYGKYRQAINVSATFKPTLYNSKPDNLILPPQDLLNAHIKRKINKKQEDIRYVPYPVLTTTFNIVSQDLSSSIGGSKYFGLGALNIDLSPFDNILKFKIAKKTGQNSNEPFKFPSSGSIIQLVFKSATSTLRVPLWMESGENDLANGVLVFKQVSTEHAILKKVFETNKNFYITITTNGIETSIYDGKFNLLEEIPRTSLDDISVDLPRAFNFSPKAIAQASVTDVTLLNFNVAVPPPITATNIISTPQRINETGLSVKQLRAIK